MDFIGFKKALFKEALAQGCEAAEAYYQRNESFSVNVLEGDIDQYEVNAKGGLNLRVRLGGRNGYAFTQKLEEPEKLVARAMDNARSIEAEDDHPMQGKCEYPALEKPERRAYSLGEQEKIDLALSLERAAKAVDPRVARTEFCTVESGRREIRISNTLGLDAFDEERTAVSVVMPITKEGEDMRNAYAFRIGEGIFDVDGCAREAVADSLALHGASPVGAGTYRALIRNSAMAAMLEAFSPMFSGDNAQKGLTLFKDKLGERIADEKITIVDDPFHPDYARAFDAEGVPSVTTTVVENGVLRSFLHNLKTAGKAGVPSTSNGGRAGADASVSVMPSVFYIRPGQKSDDALMRELGNGLFITEMDGMHAGLDPVSGEFSLIAKGMLVENGKPVRPVDQITVGGSFTKLLGGVLAVGGSLYFNPPRGGGAIGSPAILVDGLVVSGR